MPPNLKSSSNRYSIIRLAHTRIFTPLLSKGTDFLRIGALTLARPFTPTFVVLLFTVATISNALAATMVGIVPLSCVTLFLHAIAGTSCVVRHENGVLQVVLDILDQDFHVLLFPYVTFVYPWKVRKKTSMLIYTLLKR